MVFEYGMRIETCFENQDVFRDFSTGEGDVVHTLFVLRHIAFVKDENNDIVELQAFGGMNGSKEERRILLRVFCFPQGVFLFDQVRLGVVGLDFIFDHVCHDSTEEIVQAEIALFQFVGPETDGIFIFFSPANDVVCDPILRAFASRNEIDAMSVDAVVNFEQMRSEGAKRTSFQYRLMNLVKMLDV